MGRAGEILGSINIFKILQINYNTYLGVFNQVGIW